MNKNKYNREYYSRPEVKARMVEYQARYYQEKRKEYRKQPFELARRNEYQKRILRESPKLRLRSKMSCGIFNALKNGKGGKSWLDLVDYSLKDLMIHLEKQFTSKMNWNNFGSYWSTDHVIPFAWYKFDSPKDLGFKMCWGLENLQPLEKGKNYRKSDFRKFINSIKK